MFPRVCFEAFVKCDTGWRRMFSAYRNALGWRAGQKEILIPTDWNRVIKPTIDELCHWRRGHVWDRRNICSERFNAVIYMPEYFILRCLMVRVLTLGLKAVTLLLPPAEPRQMLGELLTWSSAVKYFENYAEEGQRNRTKKQHQGCAFWIWRVKRSSCEQKLL